MRFLVFRIQQHDYAFPLEMVREVVVFETVDFVEGIMDLRGNAVPVIDLRKRIGLRPPETTPDTCIIVVSQGTGHVGFIVDRVVSVTDLKKQVTMILDPDRILTAREKELLSEALDSIKTGEKRLLDKGKEPVDYKLVVLEFSGRLWGIEIQELIEIVPGLVPIPLPGQPETFAGLINLRGEILGVMDPRPLLGLPKSPVGRDAGIAIIEAGNIKAGILSEKRPDFLGIKERTKKLRRKAEGYVKKLVKADGRLIAVLDIPALFQSAAADNPQPCTEVQ